MFYFFCLILKFFGSLILKESEYIRLSNNNKMWEIKYFIYNLNEGNTICRKLNFNFFEVSIWLEVAPALPSYLVLTFCHPSFEVVLSTTIALHTQQPKVILVVSLGEHLNKNQKLNERNIKFWGNVCLHISSAKQTKRDYSSKL